ncbi:MAG: hypothetical protein IKP95_13315 [Ruminococcus sp.]|nr:hypothetical protein [Ruminococcus sp.]
MTENELIKNALTRHAPDMSQLTASELLERQRDGARVKSRRSWIGVAAVAAAGLVLTVGLLIYTHRDSRVTPGDDVDSVEDVIPSEADELPPDKGKEWVDLTILSADELEKAEYQCKAEGWPEYVFTINKHTVTAFRYLVSETVPTDSTELTGNGEFLVRKLFLRDLTGDRKPEIIAVLSPEDDPDTTLVRTLDLSTKSITEYNLSGAANISAGMIDGEVKFILEDQETGEISYLDAEGLKNSDLYRRAQKQRLRIYLGVIKASDSTTYQAQYNLSESYTVSGEGRAVMSSSQLYGYGRGSDEKVKAVLDELLSDSVFDSITDIQEFKLEDYNYFSLENENIEKYGSVISLLYFSDGNRGVRVSVYEAGVITVLLQDTDSRIFNYYTVTGQSGSKLMKRENVFFGGTALDNISVMKITDLNSIPEEERCISSDDGQFKAYYSIRESSREGGGYELVFDRVIYPEGESPADYLMNYNVFYDGLNNATDSGEMPIKEGTAIGLTEIRDGHSLGGIDIAIQTDHIVAEYWINFNASSVKPVYIV